MHPIRLALAAAIMFTGLAAHADGNATHKFGRNDPYDARGAKIFDSTGPVMLGGKCTTTRSLATGDAVSCGSTEFQGIVWNTSGQVKGSRLATASLNWNITTLQPLYTCPTGKTCYIESITYKGASGTSATASCGVGWDAGGSNVVTASTNAITATTYIKRSPAVPATTGTSTGSLGFKCGTAEGSAFTASVDVFGYAE